MKCIVGLGNYPEKYRDTRHNIGFMCLDTLAQTYGTENWKSEKKFFGSVCEGQLKGEKVYFLKPETYMNLSGKSVQALLQFYKIPIDDLYVIHDDLDLPFETIRFREKGSAGGHNGLKSIIACLGSQEFKRIKIGISNDMRSKIPTENFVLQRFHKEEEPKIDSILDRSVGALLAHLK